jgi:hypothetical protein
LRGNGCSLREPRFLEGSVMPIVYLILGKSQAEGTCYNVLHICYDMLHASLECYEMFGGSVHPNLNS